MNGRQRECRVCVVAEDVALVSVCVGIGFWSGRVAWRVVVFDVGDGVGSREGQCY